MTLKLDRDPPVGEVDEETLLESEELHVILSLNSVRVVELADRLELDDAPTIDYQIRPDVSDVLALVKDWDDALGLVIDARLSQGYFECAVIYGFGIAWAERGPDVFSDTLEEVFH
jgi:hypothetical protein